MSHSPKPAAIQIYDKEQDIDERLRRLRDHTLPDAPYLMDLTTPTRFILAPHQIDDWRRGYPFSSNEEKLQYMSFHSHTLRGDTILRTSGDWDSMNGMTESARLTSTGSSGSGSPLPNQPPRKKISLLDYKNKTAGQASAKPSPTNVSGHANSVPVAPRSIESNKKAMTNHEPAKPTRERNMRTELPGKEHLHGNKR